MLLLATLAIPGVANAAPPAGEATFRKQVAPIFQRRCLSCHNNSRKKGEFSLQTQKTLQDSGYVVPGKPGESHLLDVLLPSGGKRALMPKKSDPLTAAEVRAIRNWIKAGAQWPKNFEIRAARVTDTNWWSLRPIVRPKLPIVAARDRAWVRNPVDAFVLRKLRKKGLAPSPEADRTTLMRRIFYDLIGLPPTPAEMTAFVQDRNPDAYEKLVDRLLASPHYGERWARHWLDVVQYADTHGYDKDKLRPNAWPYRDYVIRAFNRDTPYGRFVREQIAGDVLWPGTTDGIVATGFIAAGPWDFIGHAEVPETKIDGQVARNLDRDNMVTNTMNTFCSLTIQCARCHNHKLDAVTMKHYYGMQAVFAAIDRADRTYDADPNTARRRAELQSQKKQLEARRDALRKRVAALKTPKIVALDKRIAELRQIASASGKDKRKRPAAYGYHARVAKKQETVKWVQADLGRSIPIEHVLLFAADEYGWADFGFPHRFKIEVSDDAAFSRARRIADFTARDFARPGPVPVHVKPVKVSARDVRVTATKLWSRRRKGSKPTQDWIFALGELVVLSNGKSAAIFAVTARDSIEAIPRWGRRNLSDGIYGRWTLSQLAPKKKRESVAETLLRLARPTERRRQRAAAVKQRNALLRKVVGKAMLKNLSALDDAIQKTERASKALPAMQRVYAGTVHRGAGTFRGRYGLGPREIRILHRGDVRQKGKAAAPGALPFIPGVPATFRLRRGHKEGDRRVALANWIAHRDNPLTWRSIVNRIWMHHLGRGIVDSANDFGHGGELPSHPELLDWLAVEFRDNGQSLKSLHRLICLSATYRQSSRLPARRRNGVDPRAIDSDNRLLWRMNQRRLSAEEIRDSVLSVAGRLKLKMNGPGFRDFLIEHPQHSPHYEYGKHDPNDPTIHRRTVYRFVVRSQPQPFMSTLDCANPSLSVPKRDESITALQALAMLNNRFMIVMAERFASRLKRDTPQLQDQIVLAMRLTTGQTPSARERAQLTAYAREFGLANTCRVILNLNAFVFVD